MHRGLLGLACACACAAEAADLAWTGTADQNWSVSANWSEGRVPGVGDKALLTNSLAAFAVWVTNAPAEAVGALTVSNVNAVSQTTALTLTNAFFAVQEGPAVIGQNGLLELQSGGVMSYMGEAATAPFFVVRDGGEIRINGGGLLLTNLYSATGSANRWLFLGYQSRGRMTIGDGGSFVMGPSGTGASNIVFRLGYDTGGNGLLEMSGSSSFVMPRYFKGTSFIVGSGSGASGTVSLAGSAQCLISNLVTIGSASTGVVTLAGDALLRMNGQSGTQAVGSGTRGYGSVTVRDRAVWDMSGVDDQQFQIGTGGGYGVVRVTGGSVMAKNFFYVGTGTATGLLSIADGYVVAQGQYERGIVAGMASGSGQAAWGEISVTGGALVAASTTGTYPFGANSGLSIGKTSATGCRAYGKLTLSGGSITNKSLFFVGIGVGATGVVEQTGGTVDHLGATERTFIGFGGGSGRYAMSGGAFATVKDVYVGGLPAALWQTSPVDWTQKESLYKSQASEGLLRLAGGAFTVAGADLRVGGQGRGTLVVGSNAVCVARNIMLDTNTSSTVRFEFGASGIGTLRATNVLTVCEGARLEVDTTAFTGQGVWHKLIDCASRAGAFRAEDIAVTGKGAVRQDRDEDIWLEIPCGLMIKIL